MKKSTLMSPANKNPLKLQALEKIFTKMKKVILLLLLSSCFGFITKPSKPKFSNKAYGNVANFFENENEYISFFDFNKNEVAAEVGAGSGKNVFGFTLIADNVTFYLQDIDSVVLSQKQFDRLTAQCAKLRKETGNNYFRCIGTEKETKLPENFFDKIILSATFHEFSYMDEMLADIYKKLKPGGHLYILESHCYTAEHKNYSAEQTTAIVERSNFTLLKKDGKDINNSTGLYRMVFAKR